MQIMPPDWNLANFINGEIRMPTPRIIEMDESVSLKQQGRVEVGPVVFINKFTIKPEQLNEFLKVWKAATVIERRQPGYISAQFYRGIAGSNVFINYVVWETAQHHTQAVQQPEFQAVLETYPPGVVESPHLFQKLAIPDICVA